MAAGGGEGSGGGGGGSGGGGAGGGAGGDAGAPAASLGGAGKTAAQLRFEEAQRRRLPERARKEAAKSHEEKIAGLNKLLETMPEHYDLFRISYGGQG